MTKHILKVSGTPIEEKVTKLVCDHLGNEFKTVKEMCKYYKILPSTFRYRIDKGWELEKALTIQSRVQTKSGIMDHLGNVYKSERDMCEHFGIDSGTYYTRIKSGWSMKQALETPAKLMNTTVEDHLGNKFNSIADMCKYWGVGMYTYTSRLKRGIQLKDALTLPSNALRGKNVKDHLGNTFYNSAAMSKHWGIPYQSFYARIKCGWKLKDALETPVRENKIKINAFGTSFESIEELANLVSTNYGVIISRLKRLNTYDTEIIVSVYDISGIKLKIIGLDGQARYKVPWYEDYQTTHQVIEHERPDLLSLYDKAHPNGEYNPYRKEE